ncbi:hypothetical protein SteCoe_3262 [Stentor coeruleus]|uniref:Uncharacterized protein n=1 Tax=Stentor coeruleus TaxID=5963 RepID=A0A1R2CXF5_9CILI|nr:hypothetical protein SteCoe_3262 [Stentor coeruleus]
MRKNITSEDLYPQEMIMKIQHDRQLGPIQEQKIIFEDMKKLESPLINKIVIVDSFSTLSSDHTEWDFCNFSTYDNKPNETRGEWLPANLQSFSHGLQLRTLILKSKPTITLRSIACEMHISVRLSGESTLWVMTRGVGVQDPDSMVIKIKKELDSQRVFLIFGGNIGNNHEFRFFKKQELPEIGDASEDWVMQDFIELKLTIIDNGDDRVFVSAMSSNKRVISMSCNKFIPSFRDTHIFLAGSGDSVLLKNFSAKQIERVQSEFTQNAHHECCVVF